MSEREQFATLDDNHVLARLKDMIRFAADDELGPYSAREIQELYDAFAPSATTFTSREAVIEECAKVADGYASDRHDNYAGLAADAIRALKNAAPQDDLKGSEALHRPLAGLAASSHRPDATPAVAAPDAEDAERYRWFRDECDQDRRIEILEASEGIADLIDHHIDKGRCGL